MTTAIECAVIPGAVAAPRSSAALQLRAVEPSARRARAFTRTWLRRWGEDDLVDPALLVVCELATNAIRHGARDSAGQGGARTPAPRITLVLTLRPDALDIEVRDGSAVLPLPRTAGRDDDCGRGLMIIEALAESWACGLASDGGKWVRASLSRSPAGPAR
ncbi:ATP-binding protein [Streptomyces sp. HNM0663]|uniref:ATP-binding protein n=1 Tax=Streptomyces chengmaiensis TaxID=3040919 RepID=A0ABT6HI75_9ACTN|nr:ATP-binding protein [Streptomyces chengmaiensis]MDH2388036.1 ATP-binding protein [Streptomyces chengmaiensis]